MTYVDAYNATEIVLWGLLAVGAVGIGLRRVPGQRRRYWLLAGVLVAFAGSDAVELRTGAWWRPWWLLVWKAACVASLLVLVLWRPSPRHE